MSSATGSPKWRFAAYAGGGIALAGETDDPALVVQAAGDRKVIAHDAKALTEVPPNLVFDTAIGGYLLDPARRGYPLDELAEERGIAANAGDDLATTAVLIHELANRQRPQIQERGLQSLLDEIELPLVRVLRETEKAATASQRVDGRQAWLPLACCTPRADALCSWASEPA